MQSCRMFTFPLPIMGYICNYFSTMIPIDTTSMAISVPLLNTNVQLYCDYCATYNLIRIQIHM